MHRLERLTASVAMAAAPAALIAFGAATAAAQPSTPSPSPTPNPQGATKVTIDNTNRDCFGTIDTSIKGSGAGTGFAIINVAGPSGPNAPTGPNAPGQKVIANVHLTNGAPNSSYGVRLIQTFSPQSNQDCGSYQGPYEATVQTNASGNGEANVQEDLLPGATDAFVILNSTTAPGTDFYTSPDVTFTTGR